MVKSKTKVKTLGDRRMEEKALTTRRKVDRKTSKTKEAATMFLLLVLLLGFLLVREPISSVSAESDQDMVHVETMTAYFCDTEGDAISHPVALTGEWFENSELRNFDSTPVLNPKATFTTTLPVSGVSNEEYLIPSSTYKWQFPSLDVGKGLCPTVWFEGPLSFTPDFSASRVMTPSRLRYPGGTQTITLSVTPRGTEYAGKTRSISLSVSTMEDEGIESSVISVTWPSMSEGGEITHWSQTDEHVECGITNPKIGITYTLVVAIDINLKEGIKAVEYKPYVHVADRVYLGPFETIDGSSAISETEAGTWTWETTSQHTWLCWNSIQKEVEFLAYSRALQPIEATVDFKRDPLNLKSKGKSVTCYIELPWGYNAEDIDASSVSLTKLNGELLGAPLHAVDPSEIGDHDEDGIRDLAVKFDMQALLPLLPRLQARLTVEGYLEDATPFEGIDTVGVTGRLLPRSRLRVR